MISGSFVDSDLQLEASYGSSPPRVHNAHTYAPSHTNTRDHSLMCTSARTTTHFVEVFIVYCILKCDTWIECAPIHIKCALPHFSTHVCSRIPPKYTADNRWLLRIHYSATLATNTHRWHTLSQKHRNTHPHIYACARMPTHHRWQHTADDTQQIHRTVAAAADTHCGCTYGVVTISRLLKIIGRFCKTAL